MKTFYQDYHVAEVNLKTMIDKVVKKYSTQLIQQGAELDLSGIQNQKVSGDSVWLTFVLEQLITNALKYAEPGFVLTFEYSCEDNQDVLKIRNTNSTIDKMELPKVFQRGYTGKNVRERGKSTGMGLYLCQQILQKLGGNIFASSGENETTFRICLNRV